MENPKNTCSPRKSNLSLTCFKIPSKIPLLFFAFFGMTSAHAITAEQPGGLGVIQVPDNPWPMQLGNTWEYEVHIDEDDLQKWSENYLHRDLACEGKNFTGIDGTKTRLTVKPTDGLNRYFTTRYVSFQKENRGAYHGPNYCAADGNNSWNLRWYMHNPITQKDPDRETYFTWMGSEGGIRWKRAEADVVGHYPRENGYSGGIGRTPIVESYGKDDPDKSDAMMIGLPGYTYLPIGKAPTKANLPHAVVSDVYHKERMGRGGPSDYMIKTLINDNPVGNKLSWDLEFVKTKAKNVLAEDLEGLSGETEVLGVLFFENYAGPTGQREKACEAYYFAENVGLLRQDTTWIAMDPPSTGAKYSVEEAKQLCFSLFTLYDDNKYKVQAIPDVEFDTDAADRCWELGEVERPCFRRHPPMNTMELTSYSLRNNANQDSLGFHSPDAASIIYLGGEPKRLFMSNGQYWYYRPDGTLYLEGSIRDAWKGKAGPVDGVYPWTGNGPDAIEYDGAIPAMVKESGTRGIVINNMKYWLHDYASTTPAERKFPVSGRVADLFEGYPWSNSDRLAMTTNGSDMILLTKDNYYVYYQRKPGMRIVFEQVKELRCSPGQVICPPPKGNLSALEGWKQAPGIGGHPHPFDEGRASFNPDALMYGDIFFDPSKPYLVAFKKGAVWVRETLSGPWEDWNNHLH